MRHGKYGSCYELNCEECATADAKQDKFNEETGRCPGGLKDCDGVFDPPCESCDALRTEVERLKALVKSVEWTQGVEDPHGAAGCPWCGVARYGEALHTLDCPVFRPNGDVR